MLESLRANTDRVADPKVKSHSNPHMLLTKRALSIPEIAVLVGIYTHLGCSPQFRPEVGAADLGGDWLGGYFCPCHGSSFDLAGRVYKVVFPPPQT